MIKTFKTEWYPSAEQREYIHKACGVRRWTWNWAVATFFESAKKDVFPTTFDLQKQLNNGLVLEKNYEWLSEVNSMVRGEALKDFGLAIKAYAKARQRAKRTVEKLPVDKYKPHFKKKGKCEESFRLFKKGGSEFKVHSAHDFSVVRTQGKPRIHVKTRESLAFLQNAEIKTCTFSYKAGRYFISIAYEKTNRVAKKCGSGKVGLDLGIKTAVAGYDGVNTIEHHVPSTLELAEKHTERQNRRLAKTEKGSKRHQRALQRLQRAYMHEANCKRDFREKFTTELVRSYDQINIDDFGFEGAKHLDCCRALYRVGVYAFKTRLTEKCAEYGVALNFVPRGTPTTQTCHVCGAKHKVALKERTYECPACGLVYDRDLNAAINVYNYC
jgi:putative transposase